MYKDNPLCLNSNVAFTGIKYEKPDPLEYKKISSCTVLSGK